MQRDSSPALIQRRDKLNKICQGINDMAAELARGGTYYAHQYNRIPAFAEYAVNMFALDSVSFLKTEVSVNKRFVYCLCEAGGK